MKKCCVCKKEKSDEDFSWQLKSKGKRGARCKPCQNEYSKQHHKENAQQYRHRSAKQKELAKKCFMEYMKNKCCTKCGESRLPCLDFDHKDPAKKHKGISKMVGDGYSWNTILVEINKCEILCANCHRVRTAEQQGWYKKTRTLM